VATLKNPEAKEALSNSNLLFIIAAVIFVLMYGFAIVRYPGSFLQFQTFFDLFSLNAPLIILTLGISIVMIGGNSQSALMLGINVRKTKFMSYLLCGALSGIAGFVYIMTTGAGNVGNASGFEMKAIAASIIGGTMLTGGVGNLFGSPIGALTLLTINELIRAAGVNSNFQAIVSGLLLYVFIVLQSVVVWVRGSGKFKLALPSWMRLRKE